MKTASWVISEIETGKIIMETFNPALVELLNKEKYKATPILEHLQSLNHKSA